MKSMRTQRQPGDRLLRVTLAVPVAFAAFDSAYRWSHGGFHTLALGGQSVAYYAVNGLLDIGPTLLFAVGVGLLLSHKGGRVTWSIVLACSLAFAVYCAILLWRESALLLWDELTASWRTYIDTELLGTYMVPAVYLALVSLWSLLRSETRA